MKIIAMQERSAGNGEVGEMWIDAAIFQPTTPVVEILKWAQRVDEPSARADGGRLMIRVAHEPKE